jgi:hypothetical protein
MDFFFNADLVACISQQTANANHSSSSNCNVCQSMVEMKILHLNITASPLQQLIRFPCNRGSTHYSSRLHLRCTSPSHIAMCLLICERVSGEAVKAQNAGELEASSCLGFSRGLASNLNIFKSQYGEYGGN